RGISAAQIVMGCAAVLLIAVVFPSILIVFNSGGSHTTAPSTPTPAYPSSLTPPASTAPPPTTTSPGVEPSSQSHGRLLVFVLVAVVVVIAVVGLVAVVAVRRRRTGSTEQVPTTAKPAGLLEQPIDIKVPSPDELREYANRLVDTLSAQGSSP